MDPIYSITIYLLIIGNIEKILHFLIVVPNEFIERLNGIN